MFKQVSQVSPKNFLDQFDENCILWLLVGFDHVKNRHFQKQQ